MCGEQKEPTYLLQQMRFFVIFRGKCSQIQEFHKQLKTSKSARLSLSDDVIKKIFDPNQGLIAKRLESPFSGIEETGCSVWASKT